MYEKTVSLHLSDYAVEKRDGFDFKKPIFGSNLKAEFVEFNGMKYQTPLCDEWK